MTSGEGAGTSGGTSGWRIEWAPLALVVLVSVMVAVLNATSALMEAQSEGDVIDPRGPWVFELTSVIMVILLAPFIGWAVRRFPPADGRWLMFAGGHIGASTVFTLVHIAGMVALRIAAYAVDGRTYEFADNNGDLVLPLVYEWRKDLLTYAAIAAGYWGWGYWQAQQAAQAMVAPPAPQADSRIEIRDGSRIILIDPADIAWSEAAGNYVEINTAAATHLARGTLAAFEEKLSPRGFVRVHRSRLVNRIRVKAFRPTSSGDLEITLDDNRTIAGSRRFRAAIEGG